MAGVTTILIYALVRGRHGSKIAVTHRFLVKGIIAWPVAKFLEFVLGSNHGIIYRRAGSSGFALFILFVILNHQAELKELIAMHSSHATHGGDLKTDTVTIIGATLDLQEKVVKQVRTQIHYLTPKDLTEMVLHPTGHDPYRRGVHAVYQF